MGPLLWAPTLYHPPLRSDGVMKTGQEELRARSRCSLLWNPIFQAWLLCALASTAALISWQDSQDRRDLSGPTSWIAAVCCWGQREIFSPLINCPWAYKSSSPVLLWAILIKLTGHPQKGHENRRETSWGEIHWAEMEGNERVLGVGTTKRHYTHVWKC